MELSTACSVVRPPARPQSSMKIQAQEEFFCFMVELQSREKKLLYTAHFDVTKTKRRGLAVRAACKCLSHRVCIVCLFAIHHSSPGFLETVMDHQFIAYRQTGGQVPHSLIGCRHKRRIAVQKHGVHFEHFLHELNDGGKALIGPNLKLGLFQNGGTAHGHQVDLYFFIRAVVVDGFLVVVVG